MINAMLLLLDIDGTLCPLGPGPNVAMRHLSIGSGSVSFRADLPDCSPSWQPATSSPGRPPGRTTNLLLAPALGLPALPVVRFTDPAADEVGLRHTGRTWKLPSVQRVAADGCGSSEVRSNARSCG